MPKFLTRDEIYRMLQRELPEGVYPDGAPSAFYSTAEMYSVATVLGTGYSNLARLYDNYFPQYADEFQDEWELREFGVTLDSALSLQQRRDRVLAKIRTRRRTTPDDVKKTVYTVIDSSIVVEIVEWNSSDGGWKLDESELDIGTLLAGYNGVGRTGSDLCSLSAADFGLTDAQLLEMKEEAYTYEVRIYGYTLTADERANLDKVLLEAEPCRSRHLINDNLNTADMVSGTG